MKTKEQQEQRLMEIINRVKVENPFDTFEPYPQEEGKADIWELYEARLDRLVTEELIKIDDKEFSHFWLNLIADEIEQKH